MLCFKRNKTKKKSWIMNICLLKRNGAWGTLNINSGFQTKNVPTLFSQIPKWDIDKIKYLYVNKSTHKGI